LQFELYVQTFATLLYRDVLSLALVCSIEHRLSVTHFLILEAPRRLDRVVGTIGETRTTEE
jgi:hypothetical protein